MPQTLRKEWEIRPAFLSLAPWIRPSAEGRRTHPMKASECKSHRRPKRGSSKLSEIKAPSRRFRKTTSVGLHDHRCKPQWNGTHRADPSVGLDTKYHRVVNTARATESDLVDELISTVFTGMPCTSHIPHTCLPHFLKNWSFSRINLGPKNLRKPAS